ncbi:MAG TPA: ribonuclease domain-containing protein [Usitatibacter sp.]|nr:ribonuclease domain-containing protein [Usitatibacter sp.]
MTTRALAAALSVAALAFLAPGALAQKPAHGALVVGEIAEADLPPEARATMQLIRKGGPFPYARDGAIFGNREGALPRQRRGYYREYTVKTPHVRTRGARRIIWGRGGEFWYTDDHYNHFWRIRE